MARKAKIIKIEDSFENVVKCVASEKPKKCKKKISKNCKDKPVVG